MSHDILIRFGILSVIDRSPGDVTALPDGASLISEEDWAALIADFGSEEALLKTLGVTEDIRAEREDY